MAEKLEFEELQPSDENGVEEVTYEGKPKKYFVIGKGRLVCYMVCIVVLLILVLALGALVALIWTETWLWAKDKGEATPTPTSAPKPTTIGPEPYWQVRLPENVIPEHYDVTLDIDLKEFKFSGNVDITVEVTEATPWVLVHFKKMDITSAGVYKSGESEKLETAEELEFKKNEYYVFKMKEDLVPGKYTIKMSFKAFLSGEDMAGLYKTSYRNKAGEEVYIATTQMQPTDLRRVFPCFDEPGLKASFSTEIIHDAKLRAITNMPQISESAVDPGKTRTKFKKSEKMSTYLIAIVVCNFNYVQKKTSRGLPVRVYAPPDQIDQAMFPLNITASILEYYEKLFNITYPLPKSDSIAVPNLSFRAMENWGLITYREPQLLYDEQRSSESDKQGIVSIIAHELAHQWFGNLVTMKWWNDLWLNEGFASYTTFIGMDHYRKSWKVMDQFVISTLEYALNADSLVSSHPISVTVNHPDEINELFDGISYQKGASVIRMMRDVLGEDVFNAGITEYLLDHKFGSAETKDLWNALSKASSDAGNSIDVSEVMNTWTLQMNFPVITVSQKGTNNAQVTQKRFLQDPNANLSKALYTSPYKYKWYVPFTYVQGDQDTQTEIKGAGEKTWLNMTDSIQIPSDDSKWIKGNWGQNGYYRVNYDEQNWKRLASQLQSYHKALPAADRAGLIQDAFSLAKAKLMSYSLALDLTVYMSKEDEYAPFHALAQALQTLKKMIPESRPTFKYIKKYLLNQTVDKYQTLGFVDRPEDDHLTKYVRRDVRSILCGIGYEPCLESCAKMYRDWMKNGTAIPADLSSLVYYYGISQGSVEEWDFAFNTFLETTSPAQRSQLQIGLVGASEPWLVSRYMDYTLDPSKIKSGETIQVLVAIAGDSPTGLQLAWDFLRLNWDMLFERYGKGFLFKSLIVGILGEFKTDFELKQVQDFFAQNSDSGSGARAREQAIEKIQSNIDWLSSNEDEVHDWFSNWMKSL